MTQHDHPATSQSSILARHDRTMVKVQRQTAERLPRRHTAGILRLCRPPTEIRDNHGSTSSQSHTLRSQTMITVYNDNEGIEALIRALNNGSYSVTICDTESGQTLPTAKILDRKGVV